MSEKKKQPGAMRLFPPPTTESIDLQPSSQLTDKPSDSSSPAKKSPKLSAILSVDDPLQPTETPESPSSEPPQASVQPPSDESVQYLTDPGPDPSDTLEPKEPVDPPPPADLYLLLIPPEGLVTSKAFSSPEQLLVELVNATRLAVLDDTLDQYRVYVFRGEALELRGDVRTGGCSLVIDGAAYTAPTVLDRELQPGTFVPKPTEKQQADRAFGENKNFDMLANGTYY